MSKDLRFGVVHHWTIRGYLIQTYNWENLESIDWYCGLEYVFDWRTRAATKKVFISKACNDFNNLLMSGTSFPKCRAEFD